jgi:hypothetical protein
MGPLPQVESLLQMGPWPQMESPSLTGAPPFPGFQLLQRKKPVPVQGNQQWPRQNCSLA